MTRTFLVALSMLASTIVLPQPARAQAAAAKSATAAGTVKSVTTQSLVVVSGGKDMTFTIDGTTKFIGKGLSTTSARGKIMATDAVGVDDQVRVTYQDMRGTRHAASVRITEKRHK
jgi:hypothetical protein